jgi:pimeloyl-ACP methyl ester carboxylesterase
MRRAIPTLWAFDSRAWIRSLQLPALVVCGSADPVVPVARVREVHAAIAGSSFTVVDGAAHVPTAAQRPEVTAAFARFLGEHGLKRA